MQKFRCALTRRAANTNQPTENWLNFNRPTCYSVLTNITCTTRLINTVALKCRSNHSIHTQTLRLYLLQIRSILPMEVLHCGNSEFCVFLRNIMENKIFPISVAKLMQMMPKHIFWPIIDYSGLYAAGVTRIVLCRIG